MTKLWTWLAAPWKADTSIEWNIPAIAVFVAAILGAAVIGAAPLRSALLQPDERSNTAPRDLPALLAAASIAESAPEDAASWRAREAAAHIAEHQGRFAWITSSLMLLVASVITVILAAYVLFVSLRPTRRLWTLVAVVSTGTALLVLGSMSASALGSTSWSLDEVPAVLQGLGYAPSDTAVTEYGPEGDLGKLHYGYAWLRQLALVFLLMGITSQLVFAESKELGPIKGGLERLRALIVCGGALLAIKVAVTATLLAWPLDLLDAVHFAPFTDPVNAGQTFDLVSRVRGVAAGDTTFEGARWSLMLAVAWLAVHATLTTRAKAVLVARGEGDTPAELTEALRTSGIKLEWRGTVTRTLMILAPYLSAEVAPHVNALLG